MQTMYAAKVNSPVTQLASNITATQTSIPVQDVSALPAAPNLATIGRDVDAETILYAGIDTVNSTLINVARGFQGTAKAWNAGEQIGRFYTAYDHDTFIANIQAAVDVPDGAKIYGRVGQWEQVGVPGNVISSFASPSIRPTGLTWDGINLWHADYNTDKVYQLTTTGTIVSQFNAPGPNTGGLTWDGTHLWSSDFNLNKIYQLTTAGTIVSQFASPGPDPTGLAWDGTHLWNADFVAGSIYRLTTTGTVVSQFAAPGAQAYGLTWDGTHLWHSSRVVSKIYRFTTTGTVVRQFSSPNVAPTGLAWDGMHLWNADHTAHRIYQLDVTERFRLGSP